MIAVRSSWQKSFENVNNVKEISAKIRLHNYAFYIILCVITPAFIAYFLFIAYKSRDFYDEIKVNWSKQIHEYDSELGYVPIPGAQAEFYYDNGAYFPAKYDNNGFRITVAQNPDMKYSRPLYLFLGCSFTFGHGVKAEQAFPYLVGKVSNGGYAINAGVNGYSLAHMLILAEKLIPKYRPDQVFVQYSPWLSKRALQKYGRSLSVLSKVPLPYFSESKGSITVSPPAFSVRSAESVFSKYKFTKKSTLDYISFLFEVAFPMQMELDFKVIVANIKWWTGLMPEPMKNRWNVESYAYAKIYELCRRYDCELNIVSIGYHNKNNSERYWSTFNVKDITKLPVYSLFYGKSNVRFIDTDIRLWSWPLDYYRIWSHDKGNVLTLIDLHPNPIAHQSFARSIVDEMKK